MSFDFSKDSDPVIMYLIVRESLQMTTGKMCAQVGHAVHLLFLRNQELKNSLKDIDLYSAEYALVKRMNDFFYVWQESAFRKVVLTADDKEWEKLKSQISPKELVLVVDAGLTQIPSGSETCIGIFPNFKSQSHKIIKRLQTVK